MAASRRWWRRLTPSGAEHLLSGGGPFTLLAPTNDAFDALLAQTGMTQDELLADSATLTKVLLYHIIPGQYFFRNLTSGPTLPTALLGQSVTFDLTAACSRSTGRTSATRTTSRRTA